MPRRALRSYPTNYATDLTDEQWAAIAPFVATPSPNGGRPTEIDRRAIVNALLYKNRTGGQWRMLPKDFPPMSSVRYSFDKWNRDGTCIKINDTLRQLVRKAIVSDRVLRTANHACVSSSTENRASKSFGESAAFPATTGRSGAVCSRSDLFAGMRIHRVSV